MIYRNLKVWDGVADDVHEADIATNAGVFTSPGDEDDAMDCEGLYAIPGLIDAHVHMCLDPEQRDPLAHTKLSIDDALEGMRVRAREMLQAGITTARDLGGGRYLEFTIRDEIASGQLAGPRLICAGQPITSPAGHCHFWGGEADSTEAAIDVLRKQVAAGSDLVKIMVTGGNITPGSKPVDSQFEDETVIEVVQEAHRHSLHVAAHCHGTDGIRQAAVAGVRTIEHCSWVGEDGWGKSFDLSIVKQIAENDVYVSPTINAGWQRFKQEEFVSMVQSNYEQMKSAGVTLIASTDAGIPNVKHHDLPRALPEFARFAGFSPIEVLRSATSDCAEGIGLGQLTGRIANGYSADFLLFEENPLENLSILESPRLVVSRGVECAL